MEKQVRIKVEGMNCGHCVNSVKNIIHELDGIEKADVSLQNMDATVVFDDSKVTVEAIIQNINSSNTYKASLS